MRSEKKEKKNNSYDRDVKSQSKRMLLKYHEIPSDVRVRRRRFNFTPSPVKERQDFSLWLKLVCLSVCLFVIIFAVCRRGGLGLSHVMDDEGRCGKMTRGGGSGGPGVHGPSRNPQILNVYNREQKQIDPPTRFLVLPPSLMTHLIARFRANGTYRPLGPGNFQLKIC